MSQDADAAAERTAQETRTAALATAEAAEREAAAAQAEIDAASARLRDAQARAAAARAAAAPPREPRDEIFDHVSEAGSDSGSSGLDEALLQQEAKVILNLHTQAVGVQNIRTLVPLLLDVTSPFYARWKTSFLNVLGKYSLESHVLSDAVTPESPSWVRMNCVVRT